MKPSQDNNTFVNPATLVATTLEESALHDLEKLERLIVHKNVVCPRALATFLFIAEMRREIDGDRNFSYLVSLWGRGLISFSVALYGASSCVSFSLRDEADGYLSTTDNKWIASQVDGEGRSFSVQRVETACWLVDAFQPWWFVAPDPKLVLPMLERGRAELAALINEEAQGDAA